MPLQKKTLKTPYGENELRYRLIVETDNCVRDTLHSRLVRQELLGYIANDPFFSQCGGWDFHKMSMRHDGEKWVVEFEAIVPKPES